MKGKYILWIVVYYISKFVIEHAKRNVMRQNCLLLLCFWITIKRDVWRRGWKESMVVDSSKSFSDDAACSFRCFFLSYQSETGREKRWERWWKRTILSNRIRIHASIRIAIVILNSKLPTLFVYCWENNIENYETAYLKSNCCVCAAIRKFTECQLYWN